MSVITPNRPNDSHVLQTTFGGEQWLSTFWFEKPLGQKACARFRSMMDDSRRPIMAQDLREDLSVVAMMAFGDAEYAAVDASIALRPFIQVEPVLSSLIDVKLILPENIQVLIDATGLREDLGYDATLIARGILSV